jgi:Flp pilus assembly protein TadG
MRMRLTLRRGKPNTGFLADRRSDTMLELAIVLPVFLTLLLGLFEVAYDQLVQAELDSAMQQTAFKVQVGLTAGTPNGATFVSSDFCPSAIGNLLNCNNLYVNIAQYIPSTSCTDFSAAVTGRLPLNGNALALSNYATINTTSNGNSGTITQTNSCLAATSSNGFCNAGPSEFIIMNAVYTVPSFLLGLIPSLTVKNNGALVHAAYSSTAFYTEGFPAVTTGAVAC